MSIKTRLERRQEEMMDIFRDPAEVAKEQAEIARLSTSKGQIAFYTSSKRMMRSIKRKKLFNSIGENSMGENEKKQAKCKNRFPD